MLSKSPKVVESNREQKPCIFHLMKKCNYGDKCKWSHKFNEVQVRAQFKSIVCPQKRCPGVDICLYSHPKMKESKQQYREKQIKKVESLLGRKEIPLSKVVELSTANIVVQIAVDDKQEFSKTSAKDLVNGFIAENKLFTVFHKMWRQIADIDKCVFRFVIQNQQYDVPVKEYIELMDKKEFGPKLVNVDDLSFTVAIPLKAYGGKQYKLAQSVPLAGSNVAVISKNVVTGELFYNTGTLESINQQMAQYTIPTKEGYCGSPVVDDNLHVISMHSCASDRTNQGVCLVKTLLPV